MSAVQLYLHAYSLRFHFQYVDGYDVFRFIRDAVVDGFAGVSISANGPGYRWLGGTTDAHFQRVRDCLQEHRLQCDLDTSGTAPDHLRTMLAVAMAVGATQLRTYTRYRGASWDIVEATTRDLAAAAPVAADFGVRIMLENHEHLTGPEVRQIVEAVNHPSVGMLFDYGNSMMVMEEPLAAVDAMAPYSWSAHLKDHVMLSPADSPDGRLSVLGVPIGQGNLPIREITQRLVKAGLERIAFENVWGYRAPVSDNRLTDKTRSLLGRDAFAFARPPFDAAVVLPEPERLPPERLVALERTVMEQSLAWVRETLLTP